jgi:hypothetical protein
MVYATVQPTSFGNLQANYEDLTADGANPLLLTSIQRTLENRAAPPGRGEVLTDERAPIEWIINSMVLRFVFSGEIEQLQ